MTGDLGTIYVDETAFDIERIRLGEGRVWFTGRHEGPVGDLGDMLRVHAPDGTVVLIGKTEMNWPPMKPGVANVYIELPVSMEGARVGERWAGPA